MQVIAYLEYRFILRIIRIPPLSSPLMITNEESVVNIFCIHLHTKIYPIYIKIFIPHTINTRRLKNFGV